MADCENGEAHGTAVAELVVDMAPGAQLYIADPESPIDYRDTIRWMTSQGVRILNASSASGYLFDGPGDGTSGREDSTYEEVDLGVSLGAFWVNSAGNEGDAGWMGPWRDDDADDMLDWAPGDDTNTLHLEAGDQVRVAMRWPDEWGAASSDYDIGLLRGTTVVASGSDFQDGEGDPYEVFDFEAPDEGDYDLVVTKFEAEPVERIQILIYASAGLQMEHRVAAGTLPSPADSANPGMISVGAVDVQKPDTIETYSSRGPTVDGRVKPDLVAGDCMATVTIGLFCGTSAAAPLTTGAAALALESDPTMGPTELAVRLRSTAQPLGDPAPNGTFGAGLLRLGAPMSGPPPSTTVALRAAATAVTWPSGVKLTATLSPPIPAGRQVQFQASSDGSAWTSIGSAETKDGRTASLTIAPVATRRYRAVALGTAVTSRQVTVAVRQRLSVRPSIASSASGAARVVRAGDLITFESVVRPARADLPRATVEYAVYERVGGEWVLDRRIEITADRAGVARLPLHLEVPGQWYVRARAKATSGAAGSTWSPIFRYDVRGSSAGTLERRWSAGFSGGSATFSAFSGGASMLTLHATGLPRSAAVAISIQRGTCGDRGTRLVALRPVRSAASGAFDATLTLSTAQRAALERATASATGSGALSLVLRAGSATRCALLVPRPMAVARIATGEEASGVAVDGEAIWVTNIFDDTLSRIDPVSNVVTASIPVPGYPAGVVSDGLSVWVTHLSTGMLSRVDIATREVAETISVGALPGNLALAAGAVWVVVEGENLVMKVDPRTDEILDAIEVAPDPFGIAAVGDTLWVTSPGAGVVTRIDATSGEVVAEIDVPDAYDVAASADAVWISIRPSRPASGAVVRIDPKTNEVVARVPVGYEPAGMTMAGDSLYVAMAGEPTLVQVRVDRVRARIAVGMKSVAVARGFGSLWLLHPYGAGIPGSGLFDGGVTRLNL